MSVANPQVVSVAGTLVNEARDSATRSQQREAEARRDLEKAKTIPPFPPNFVLSNLVAPLNAFLKQAMQPQIDACQRALDAATKAHAEAQSMRTHAQFVYNAIRNMK